MQNDNRQAGAQTEMKITQAMMVAGGNVIEEKFVFFGAEETASLVYIAMVEARDRRASDMADEPPMHQTSQQISALLEQGPLMPPPPLQLGIFAFESFLDREL